MIQLPDHPDIAYALSHGCAPWENADVDCDEDVGPNLYPDLDVLLGIKKMEEDEDE